MAPRSRSMAPSIRPSSTWSRGSKCELARRADGLEHDEVVLAAGRGLVGGDVGDRPMASSHSCLGLGLGGLGLLDLRGQRPWPARAAPASPRPAPGGSACRSPSARPAGPRTPRSPAAGASSAASARSTTSADRPRLAWAARTRSGSSRSSRGRSSRSRLVGGREASGMSVRPRVQGYPQGDPGILARVLDRPRHVTLALGRPFLRRSSPLLALTGRPQDRVPARPASTTWGRNARGLGRRPRSTCIDLPAPRRARLRHHRHDGPDRCWPGRCCSAQAPPGGAASRCA